MTGCPVDRVPTAGREGGRRYFLFRRTHLAFLQRRFPRRSSGRTSPLRGVSSLPREGFLFRRRRSDRTTPAFMALQAFSRSKTSRKWAPFRVGATAPIQPRYRAAFAFSDLLYPHFQQPSLRSTCPRSTSQWRKYGLTEFHNHHKSGLGPACSPVTRCQRVPRCKRDNQSRTLLVEACQQLWLHAVDGVYQQFTYVGRTTQPSASPACCSQGLHGASRRPHTTDIMGLHCQDASHPAVTGDALSLGYFLAEQKVSCPGHLAVFG